MSDRVKEFLRLMVSTVYDELLFGVEEWADYEVAPPGLYARISIPFIWHAMSFAGVGWVLRTLDALLVVVTAVVNV